MFMRVILVLLVLLFYLPLLQMCTGLSFGSKLAGVVHVEERPVFSFRSFLDSRFQEGISNWFDKNFGFRAPLIKTNNQIAYNCFREAGPTGEGIVIGSGGTLYSKDYVHSFLELGTPFNLEGFRSAATLFREAQDLLARRGVQFVVVVTPSKASIYPEYIPGAYCRFRRWGPTHRTDAFIGALKEHGVHLVDGHAIFKTQKEHRDFPLFPEGGIHWNEAGAFMVMEGLYDEMEKLTGKKIPRLEVEKIIVDDKPNGADKDLLDILNLWWPKDHYPTPHVNFKPTRPSHIFRPSILLEGGSFSYTLAHWLGNYGLSSRADYLNYYQYIATYPDLTHTLRPLGKLDWERDVFSRDFIILEINELYMTDDPSMVSQGFVQDMLVRLKGLGTETRH